MSNLQINEDGDVVDNDMSEEDLAKALEERRMLRNKIYKHQKMFLFSNIFFMVVLVGAIIALAIIYFTRNPNIL